MRKIYLVLIVGSLLVACSESVIIDNRKEINQHSTQVDDKASIAMLHFKSANAFLETFDNLLTKKQEEQITWAVSQNKDALLANIEYCTDSLMLSAPKAFQALFNKKLEVQINDSVMQYSNGNMYLVAINNKRTEVPTKCGETESSYINKEEVHTRQQGEITFDKYNMNHQYGFRRTTSGSDHKYVQGFRSYSANINGARRQILIMDFKLEYKSGGKWRQSNDPRDLILDLNCNVSIKNASFWPLDFVNNLKSTHNNIRGIFELPVAGLSNFSGLPSQVWVVNCTGRATHTVTNESNTRWIDVWY